MTIGPALRAELASLTPSSVIELYTIETSARLHGADEVYRFTSTVNAKYGLGAILWNSQQYWPFPIEAEGFSYSGKGTLPRPTVRVANAEGAITSILAEINVFNPGNDLIGARFTRIRTLARFLDHANFEGGVNPWGTPDPSSTMPEEIYYIDRKSMECRELVEFELCARYDLTGIRAPKRQCLKRCGWIYRGDGCGYAGTDFFDENDNRVFTENEDKCGHRLTSCKTRFGQNAQLPYGGFPGIGNYNF